MILLCDEDIGTHVPKALRLVRYKTMSLVQKGWRSWKDTEWLTIAGDRGWLVFSANKKMLKVPEERDTIIKKKVGIVFLNNGEERIDQVLRMLLNKWSWLQQVDQSESRPFAYFVSLKGRAEKQPLDSNSDYLSTKAKSTIAKGIPLAVSIKKQNKGTP